MVAWMTVDHRAHTFVLSQPRLDSLFLAARLRWAGRGLEAHVLTVQTVYPGLSPDGQSLGRVSLAFVCNPHPTNAEP